MANPQHPLHKMALLPGHGRTAVLLSRRQLRGDVMGRVLLRIGAAAIISILAFGAAWYLPPSWLPDAARTRLPGWTPFYRVNLDSQGGTAVLLRIKGPANADILRRTAEGLRKRFADITHRPPRIEAVAADRLLVEVPYADDGKRLAGFLAAQGRLTFQLIDAAADPAALTVPVGDTRLPLMGGGAVVVDRRVLLGGEHMIEAGFGTDRETGQGTVNFVFDAEGTKQFATLTTANVGRAFAVILDGMVLTAPVIREPITGGRGVISGAFSIQAAADLSVLIRSGALPAPLEAVRVRTVTASADTAAAQLVFIAVTLLLCGLPLAATGLAIHFLLWRPHFRNAVAAGRPAALSPVAAVAHVYRNYAEFKGRARRSEYWFFALWNGALTVVAAIIDIGLNPTGATAIGLVGGLLLIANLLPGLGVGVRRLHDTNRSGWWLLLALVPLIGPLLLTFWFCRPGSRGDNGFGADPLAWSR